MKSLAQGGVIMGSTGNNSIQGQSAGGISGLSSSNANARPSMTQTAHGKKFPYNAVHRKTNSNKLPIIPNKDGASNQATI